MADSSSIPPWQAYSSGAQAPATQPGNNLPPWQAYGAQSQATSPEADPGAPTGTLDKVARGLDYAGGNVRGRLFQGIGAATGNDKLVTAEDLDNIARGKGPGSAEYLARMGVNEGISADLPIVGKVTQRGVEGFALDVATDPITYLGQALKVIPGAAKLLGLSADATAKAAGEAIYKAGFSKIDAKMAEQGAAPLSELLLESGAPTGTTSQIAEKVQKMATGFSDLRDQLYQKATDLGVTVDLEHPLEKAEALIEDMSKDKRADVREQAQALSEYLQRNYKAAGKVDLATLSQWKTDLYNQLPKNFFQPNGKITNVGAKFNAALASDFRQAVVDAGNTAEKGLGDSIAKINDKWGTLIDAAKPVAQQVKQAAGAPIISPIKAAVTAANPYAGIAMEIGDLAKTTVVRTNVGAGLMKAGETGAAGVGADFLRRSFINSQQGPPTLGQSVMHGGGAMNSLQKVGGGQ